MTSTAAWTGTVRTYTRVSGEEEQVVRVNVDAQGRVRMTAESLDHLLTHVGFTEHVKEPTP